MSSRDSLPLLLAALLGAGCRRDMFDQPKYKSLARSDLFDDGASARPTPEGAAARGQTAYFSGVAPAPAPAAGAPSVTVDLLRRGRTAFGIHCSPCHGLTGDGNGMIVQRGYKQPSSYHIDRLRQQPIDYFFDVITNGFGVMPSYAHQVGPADRWAIAAYVRVLQLSQSAPLQALPAEDAAGVEAGQ